MKLIETIASLNQFEDDRHEEEFLKLERDLILSTEKKRDRCCESSADYDNIVNVPMILGEHDPSKSGDPNHDVGSVKNRQGEIDPI